MVGHILVNCPEKNQGKRPVVPQLVKPPVKLMVKPPAKHVAEPSVPKGVKQVAKPSVSTSSSTQTGEKPMVKLSKPQRKRRNKRLRKLKLKLAEFQPGEASTSSPMVDEGKPKVPGTISNRWYVGSGCSRNMTGNMALLQDVKPFRGGYVAFVGEKGGSITCQGMVSNGCISLDNVNYCEQLKHNLLNVSQMCDKEYSVMFNKSECLVLKPATEIDSILWHRKLRHISYHKMNHLVRNGLVTGIPKLRFAVADDCTKDETAEILQYLILSLESLCKLKVRRIRSDNGTEFKNNVMELLCLKKGIRHEFSAPYTPQQNGVATRKNRTLIETTRTMLLDAKLPVTFWAEAVNTTFHVLNRVLVYKDRKSKFHAKAVEGIFLGYVTNSPCKRVYNIESRFVEEWFEVDYSKHNIPSEPTGLAWGVDYDALFKSFNLPDLSAEDAAKLYEFCCGGDDSNFSTRATVPIPTSDSNATSAPGTLDGDNGDEVHVERNDAQVDPNVHVGNDAPVDPINIESSSDTLNMGELSTNLESAIQEPQVPKTRVH
ncbi:hypothetical protein L1987_08587 [Smallanthus sonchifolius]|uniref:Uncharacterized protein n=1 Tax=Smallanthus sonchifolius TaxID=185202 RepID=A0ACB9JLK0_9ASTR|nr:hypothetical protein L1987_08587 [Smallanthus sonchifolius]